MQKSGIYKLEFTDGLYYIGQSTNTETRKNEHSRLLLLGNHHNYKIQQKYDINKELPKFTVIKYCEPEYLNKEEDALINLLDSRCLNIKAGGSNNFGINALTAKYLTCEIELAFLILANNPGISHKDVAEYVGIDISTVHDISAGRNRAFTEMKQLYPELYTKLINQKASNTRGKNTVVLQHNDGRVATLVSGKFSEFCRNNSVQNANLSKVISGVRKATMGWKLIEKYENF